MDSKSSPSVTPDHCTIDLSSEILPATSYSSPLHKHYSTISSLNKDENRFSSNRNSDADSLQSSGLLLSNHAPSPFTFRRGDSWVGGSKLDYLQERHLKAPPAASWYNKPPSFSSNSSSSSHGSSPSAVERRSMNSIFASFSRSRRFDQLSGLYSNAEVNKANVSEDNVHKTSQEPILSRPPLQRNRSQSMDVLERFKNDARVKDLQDLAGLKGSDSVAVGTVSIIEVTTLPQRKQKMDSTLRPIDDKFRVSRLLTRKPSTIGQERSTSCSPTSVPPKVPEKEEMSSLRHTAPREGALSRLTDSIRGKKFTNNFNKGKNVNLKNQEAKESTESAKHRRHQSTGSNDVFVISKSKQTRTKVDEEKLWAPSNTSALLESGGNDEIGGRKASISQRGVVAMTDKVSTLNERAGLQDTPRVSKSAQARSKPIEAERSSDGSISFQQLQRQRSKSLSKIMEPIRSSFKIDSAEGIARTHLRDQSSEMEDDFYSATSLTPSNSDAVFDQYILANETAHTRVTTKQSKKSPAAGKTLPLSLHGSQSSMTKSESDPVLISKTNCRLPLPSFETKKQALKRTSPIQPSRRAIHTSAPDIKHISERVTELQANKSAAKGDVAVSDTEEDPLPPPRSSSRAVLKKGQFHSSPQRKRALSRPSLRIDTKAFVSSPSPPTRPSSALGMSADLQRVAQRSLVGTEGQRRRPSLASLSIKDDMEFLQALEYVRKVNQIRIRKQDEDANRVEQMARLGMASVNRRAKSRNHPRDAAKELLSSRTPLLRRSSSVSAVSTKDSASMKSDTSASSFTREDVNESPPSALELGVGKASGKLRDGAFINDDDWKREVKALFVIREIVLTERSYARHLEALLQAIRTLYPTQRRATGSSMSRFNVTQVPEHIAVMRNLLPQLIALSQSLANRIDENPTAAGVGTAFRLVSCQMEATFIAWSSIITNVMDALRISEKGKSKSKDRIGLIHLHPLQHAKANDQAAMMNGFVSVPCSPTSALKAQRVGTERKGVSSKSDETNLNNSPMSMAANNGEENKGQKSVLTVSKRRSTLSGLSPALAANLRAKTSLSVLDNKARKKADTMTSNSATPQSLGRRAMDAMISSKPPLPSLTINWSSIAPLESASDIHLQSKSTSALNAPPTSSSSSSSFSSPDETTKLPTKAQQHPSTLEYNPGKSLSALDVVIMPTQRIPRYLLLLRDLNVNTPPQSLSHIRLQRCLDFVARVASSCDKASRGDIK